MAPTISQPIRDQVLESIAKIDGQIVVKIAGDDLVERRHAAQAIERDRAARYGLNAGDIQDMIQAALAGKATTSLWQGERKFAVAVRLPEGRRVIANLPATPIATPDGGYTTLGNVANIRETTGAMNIAREAGRRTMAIGIFIKDRDMGSVVKDMKGRVTKNIQVPASYEIKWSGEFENQKRAMARLAIVVPISLLLFDAFGSFKKAVLILVHVPLALIGGFVALWLFSIPLSVSAALGLLPMALSHDIGSETQRPLAIVVIGGLFTATLLTLVLLPVLYVAWFSPTKAGEQLPKTPAGA